MKSQKKKILNFRIMFILMVAIIISIIVSTKFFVSEKSKLILLILACSLFVLSLVLTLVLKKKILIVITATLSIISIVFGLIFNVSGNLNKNQSLNAENYQIYGKIYNLNNNSNNKTMRVYLKNVTLKSDENEIKLYGNLILYLSKNSLDTSKIKIGKTINAVASLSFFDLQDENLSKSVSFLSRQISATAFAYSYQITINEGNSSLELKDKIKNVVYEKFEKTDTTFTSTGYGMLFGDSDVLDDDIKSIFVNSGIAHLLAVSGFHVSIIVVILSFILKKLKTKNSVNLVVIAAILGFYAYLCDFSVSVIRASIMAILALFAVFRYKEYDRLSAASMAACLILIVSPLQLFNVSFLLSFISVFSIIFLKPLFDRLLDKIFYEKFASLLSLTISVGIGLFFVQLYYFGKVPLFSFLSNIITVPIISAVYVFLIVAVILSFVFPFCVSLISFYGWIMKHILQLNNFISSIGISFSFGGSSLLLVVLSLFSMFFVSDYLFVNKKIKIFGACGLCILMVLLFIF